MATLNPFDKVKDFDIPDRGHVPWPAWTIDYVEKHAWPDLVRMTRLGIMTCQRGSDIIRMGKEHRDRNGIWCRPKKTRKRRRSFLIPLAAADALGLARWRRWLADTQEGRIICRRWKEWVAAQVKKYDWDIDPDDADHPTIHGLRGTGILARAEQGYDVDQIANDVGVSRQNVGHYMRFKDQMKVAAEGQKRLRLIAKED